MQTEAQTDPAQTLSPKPLPMINPGLTQAERLLLRPGGQHPCDRRDVFNEGEVWFNVLVPKTGIAYDLNTGSTMTDANLQDSKSGKSEEKPGPPRNAIGEPAPAPPKGTPAKDGPQDSKGEKSAEKPELLRYEIVLPGLAPPKASPVKTAPQDPVAEESEEKAEEDPERPRYAIMAPPPEPPSDFANFNLHLPTYNAPEGVAQGQNPPQGPAAPRGSVPTPPSEPARKFSQNPTNIYITAGVVLGLLFGIIVAMVTWRMAGPAGPSDLGQVTSTGTGLKGHLFTKWEKKVEYHLTFEPSDPSRLAGFAFAVAHPPRPLSIEIHLQDAQGFVLCSRDIVLKYDAAGTPALDASDSDPDATKTDAGDAAGNPSAKAAEDLLAAQEAERELGKDVFQNQIGPNGQPSAIESQGEIPCSEKAFASAASWSFTPDFPPVAEQDEALKPKQEGAQGTEVAQASPGHPGHPSSATTAARKKIVGMPPPKLLPFSIEGDDEIVDFDAFRGIIQTRDGKTFFFDRSNGDISDPRWMDYPVGVHYKCDQSSMCSLSHAGTGSLRARLKR